MDKLNINLIVLVIIGCALVAPLHAADTNAQCGRHRTARIIGGWKTRINEYPMVAGLWMGRHSKVVCGATIVSNRHVVTAAHCVSNAQVPGVRDIKTSEVKVLVGANDYNQLYNSPYGKSYDVDRFIVHPNFAGAGDNDVALVRTKTAIAYNAGVGPACLPVGNNDQQYVGRHVDVVGWGRTSANGKVTSVLQKTSVAVAANEVCRHYWGSVVKPEHLCTNTGGRDFCVGDEGGPVFEETNGRLTLVGVMGVTVCDGKHPSVSARVSSYAKWIKANMQK